MRVRLIKLREPESSKSSLHAILTLCDVVQGGQDGGMLRRSRCSLAAREPGELRRVLGVRTREERRIFGGMIKVDF